MALSKAKAYVSEKADEEEFLAPWEVGAEVFEDEPLQRRFEEAVAEENLPDRVPVEKKVAQRVAKNHKIRTDTGIEDHVSFRVRPQLRIHRVRQHPERTDSNRAEEHRQHREQIAGRRRARRRVLPRVCFAGLCACVSCYHGFECVTPSFYV